MFHWINFCYRLHLKMLDWHFKPEWGVKFYNRRLKFFCEPQSTIWKWRAVIILRIGIKAKPTGDMKEGSHSAPPCGFGLFLVFWGSRRVNWGPTAIVRASNESWIKGKLHSSKKKICLTQIFRVLDFLIWDPGSPSKGS